VLQIQQIDASVRAQRQVQRGPITASQAFAITTDSVNWTPIGPRPTDPDSSPTSGRVNSIAIDPRDTNVIYIGAAEGGVWKTTDGGASWKPLTDTQPSLATGAIAIDPSNPDTVYVGTGEENFSSDSYQGAGILKSTDAGETWTNYPGPFEGLSIAALTVHPTDSQILLCASTLGISRSIDGGRTWATPLGGTGISVFFDTDDPSIAWATLGNIFGNTRNGVYRSTDGGATWQRAPGSGTSSFPTVNVGRIELTMAPSNHAILYAQVHNLSTNGLLDIYKTTDSGTTWRRLNVTAAAWGTQMWFDNTIRVSPNDANVVWSGGLAIYRSLDGGVTWTQPQLTGPNGVNSHVDFHALVFTPDGNRLYTGNDGGIYSTNDVTAPRVNWIDLNTNLAITKFYPGMSVDPVNPALILGGTQDNGTQRQGTDGIWQTVACGDGGYTAIDPAFPNFYYGACQRIQIGRNIGLTSASWVPAMYGINTADAVQFIPPFIIDPSDPQTLYFGTFRLWKSKDSGGRWAPLSADLSGGNRGTIKTIAPAPNDSRTIYAATSNGRVQVTMDAQNGLGAVWTDRSAGLPTRTPTRIAVDPLNPATAYLTFSGFANAGNPGHVFRTSDAGATWTNISGNLPDIPVTDIVIDPDVPDTLYLATDAGVQVTTDGGGSWSSLAKGLPNVVVHSLVLHRKTRVLRAGTHGRSVWEILLPLARPSLQPEIASLSPSSIEAGGTGLVLSVTGSNFVAGTVIRWNGQNRPTRFVDSAHLTADIPAADIALTGRAAVTAFTESSGAGASLPKGFVIGAPPRSASNAFVSAANPGGGTGLAPRSIASLYGTNLAAGVAVADGNPPLPFTLNGTSLWINGNAVPLFFVSPTQINFQIPLPGLLSGTVPLTIVQGAQTTQISIAIRPYSPALFTTNSQGTGQASTLIAGTTSLAAPEGAFPDSRPAKPGEFLSIYCTGLGAVTNIPNLGAPSPSNPLAATSATPTVTIGGVSAPVSFSGLAPGFVGLYQVNVKVPDGIAPGDAVPLIVTIGGVPSNTATIAVQ
jgi:uncharacterized protein (TIGR03437 family)